MLHLAITNCQADKHLHNTLAYDADTVGEVEELMVVIMVSISCDALLLSSS